MADRVGFLAGFALLAFAIASAGAQRPSLVKPKPTPRPTPKPTAKVAPKSSGKKIAKPKLAPKPEKRPGSKANGAIAPKGQSSKPADPPAGTGSEISVNSLGMRFVRFGDIEVCAWPVRVQDFAAFTGASGRESTPRIGFAQGPDHPVVNVTWKDAVHFCEWLTETERLAGRLPNDREYRLPTDREWSAFAGLGEEPGATPEARDLSSPDLYPWGFQWPPPPGVGNFADEDSGLDVHIPGYKDGFSRTSPVGSFPPNAFGIFDIAGNVSQWCRDAWSSRSRDRVIRGSSWFNGGVPVSLLTSVRVHAAVDRAGDSIGFRVVIGRVDAR